MEQEERGQQVPKLRISVGHAEDVATGRTSAESSAPHTMAEEEVWEDAAEVSQERGEEADQGK